MGLYWRGTAEKENVERALKKVRSFCVEIVLER